MQHFIDAAPDVRLWVEEHGPADAPPLPLIMGAQASGMGWPDELVHTLAAHHRVIRYDHRDTGRSTWSFDERPFRGVPRRVSGFRPGGRTGRC
jgi:pimeloyl-ACP methyl ester carboxylesterase